MGSNWRTAGRLVAFVGAVGALVAGMTSGSEPAAAGSVQAQAVAVSVAPNTALSDPATVTEWNFVNNGALSAPAASQRARRASRKPGSGGTTPMFPATGSTITAARPSP